MQNMLENRLFQHTKKILFLDYNSFGRHFVTKLSLHIKIRIKCVSFLLHMTSFKNKYFHLILGLQAFFKDISSAAFEGLKVKILDLVI
jgi:hypothetical protein